MTTQQRQDLIGRISEASRRPCPDIAAIRHYRHKTTSATHSPFGMPFNCRHEDYDLVLLGYAYADKNGVTYGTRGASVEELTARWEAGQVRSVAEFAGQLAEMTDSQLESQANYWLPACYTVKSPGGAYSMVNQATGNTVAILSLDDRTGLYAFTFADSMERQAKIWKAELLKTLSPGAVVVAG